MAAKARSFSLTDWRANDVKQLRKIWNDLRPDLNDQDAERTFQDHSLTLDQAGVVFERWVLEAFRLSGMSGQYAFRVPLRTSGNTREQIDGMVLDGWQAFLVEAKFWTGKVDFGPITLFHVLVESRPVGTIGLFFSAFGYTLPALESAEFLRPVRVLLFDAGDLDWALGQKSFKGSMAKMVRQKWIRAVQSAQPHLPASDPIDLFN